MHDARTRQPTGDAVLAAPSHPLPLLPPRLGPRIKPRRVRKTLLARLLYFLVSWPSQNMADGTPRSLSPPPIAPPPRAPPPQPSSQRLPSSQPPLPQLQAAPSPPHPPLSFAHPSNAIASSHLLSHLPRVQPPQHHPQPPHRRLNTLDAKRWQTNMSRVPTVSGGKPTRGHCTAQQWVSHHLILPVSPCFSSVVRVRLQARLACNPHKVRLKRRYPLPRQSSTHRCCPRAGMRATSTPRNPPSFLL